MQTFMRSVVMYVTVAMVMPLYAACEADNPQAADTRIAGARPVTQPVSGRVGQESQPVGYQPPLRGAPAARVGGGTRGSQAGGPVLYALTPDHLAMTGTSQPVLYWYVSEPGPGYYEFSLINDLTLGTVIETRLDNIVTPGIHQVSLQELGVRLIPGVEYHWYVAYVGNASQRSMDIIAGGMMEHVEQRNAVPVDFSTASLADLQREAHDYAAAGLWYDALFTLSQLIEARPGDDDLREQRASLLEQAGLQDVADAERQAGGFAVAGVSDECSG